MDSLYIGVSSWIIQDGNYPDFRIGDALNIALQFHPYRICESKNSLASIHGIPELRYAFRVRGIELETTPWLTTIDSQKRTMKTRDNSQISFLPVAETDAWSDDNGNAHYVLELERIGNGAEQSGARK